MGALEEMSEPHHAGFFNTLAPTIIVATSALPVAGIGGDDDVVVGVGDELSCEGWGEGGPFAGLGRGSEIGVEVVVGVVCVVAACVLGGTGGLTLSTPLGLFGGTLRLLFLVGEILVGVVGVLGDVLREGEGGVMAPLDVGAELRLLFAAERLSAGVIAPFETVC